MEYIGNTLLRNVAEYPERIAVTFGNLSLTYKELNKRANCAASVLKKLGLGTNDRLGVLMSNSIELIICLYACQKLGVGFTLIHSKHRADEISRILRIADVKRLIYSGAYREKALAAVSLSGGELCCSELSDVGISTEGDFAEADELQTELDGTEDSVVLFTSGTTSQSKGILRTQEMMKLYSSLLYDPQLRQEGSVMLTSAPLYHAAGLCCAIKMLINAGTLVLTDGFQPEEICFRIIHHNVTQLALVPPILYQRLYQSGFPDKYNLSSVNLVHSAAGRMSRECLSDLYKMFPHASLRLSWGSTEASNVTCTILSRDQIDAKPELAKTIGTVNAVSEIMLVDEAGQSIEGSGSGEAFVRSPLVFSGYLKDPALTRDAFSGSWFKTEDILSRDEDGYFYLLDRKRDIIKTGGENVYAQEVEQALLDNPAIAECAVVGIPDAEFEEAIAAAIVLKPNMTLSQEDLTEYCKTVLPSFKKPRFWVIMDELPKNDIGKVRKRLLKENASSLFSRLSH